MGGNPTKWTPHKFRNKRLVADHSAVNSEELMSLRHIAQNMGDFGSETINREGFPYCTSWKCTYGTDRIYMYKPNAFGLLRCPDCTKPLTLCKKKKSRLDK
jgi:hypothetical protein